MNADELTFLDVEDVIELHATQLEEFGGGAGLREHGLLESAAAQPQRSIGGDYVDDACSRWRAAYLVHIVSNHPFVDGSTPARVLTALVFLDVNGFSIARPSTKSCPA